MSIQNSLHEMAVYNNNISFNDEVTNNIYVNSEDLSIGNCPQIFIDNPDILKYIIESMITVRGEITRPAFIFLIQMIEMFLLKIFCFMQAIKVEM